VLKPLSGVVATVYKGEPVPEISRFLGVVIAMNYGDHPPPHFHARYGNWKALIAIQALTLLQGRLPPRVFGLVTEWAALHQVELMEDWDLAQQQASLFKIEPLE
jgi:hypothetical protein